METLTNVNVIRGIMEKSGFKFSKAMGQNFLVNPSVCPRIAEMGGSGPDVGALEVGPGIGVLTAELAKRCRKVVSVELDTRLLPILDETLAEFDNVKIINGDIMEVDLHKLIAENFAGMDVIVCANLPYYITSPVIMKLLEEKLPIKSITVMVQKEAAQRICAPLPSRQAGAITAAVNYYTQPNLLFNVSPGSFMPPPEVQSSVIRLDIREETAVDAKDEAYFFKIVKAAFSQRRKTLLNTLSSGLGMEKAKTAAMLEAANVNAGLRAEQLAMEDFARLAKALGEMTR